MSIKKIKVDINLFNSQIYFDFTGFGAHQCQIDLLSSSHSDIANLFELYDDWKAEYEHFYGLSKDEKSSKSEANNSLSINISNGIYVDDASAGDIHFEARVNEKEKSLNLYLVN